MSVINKALSELDKRKNNTEYGKYVPNEKSHNHGRTVLIILFSVSFLLLAGAVAYRFGVATNENTDQQNQNNIENNLVKNEDNAEATANETQLADSKASIESVKASKQEQSLNAEASSNAEPAGRQAGREETLQDNASQDKGSNALAVNNNEQPVEQAPKGPKAADTADTSPAVQSKAVASQVEVVASSSPKTTPKEINEDSQAGNYDVYEDDGIDAYAEVAKDMRRERANAAAREKTNSYIRVSKKKLSPDEQIELYRREADRAVARGDSTGAITAYRNVLSVRSTDTGAREKLAGLLYGSGRTLDAIKVLDHGIRLNPNHYDFRLYLARIYSSAGRNAEAIKVLNQAVPPVSGNVDYYATLAEIARNSGDYDSAENAYRRLSAAGGRDGKWYLGLAIVQEKKGQSSAALASYRNAGKLYLSKASRDFVQKRIQVLESTHYDR